MANNAKKNSQKRREPKIPRKCLSDGVEKNKQWNNLFWLFHFVLASLEIIEGNLNNHDQEHYALKHLNASK